MESTWQLEQFEEHRTHLKAVAYRMLGSISDADDALQEAWLRLSRADASTVENIGGWLTTIVGRVCLDMLRTRRARREDYVGTWLPEPIVSESEEGDPAQEAVLADSIGLALFVVLDTLTPPERLAFVLHDMFGVSFEEIAPIVDRTPAWPVSAKSFRPSSRRREPATSRHSWRCSTPVSSSASTRASTATRPGRRSPVPPPSHVS
jgi:RNA polymerase sigma factor (sigma-70 family)